MDLTKENKEIISSAEAKRQEIIKSGKFLLDTKNYKHHPGSFYKSRLLMNQFNKWNHQIFYLKTLVL
jgi:hypothetical protein